ncbi:hypothetical protein ACFWA6_20315 [Streptomyces sp. NPDC060020]|uniref:hypothetical protein n=1 Tax=Streptomyces sp. NPDC060020 TaxID=3347038 RepID=UPI0036A4979D
MRERRHREANSLLHDALHPPRTTPSAEPSLADTGFMELAQVQARQIETYDRLTRALEQQGELRQAADNSARLVMVLLGVIHTLQDRVTGLTEERDHLAHTELNVARAAAQRKLDRAEAQTHEARLQLERAEEKRHQAEELASRLQQQIEELADALDRLREDETLPHDELPSHAAALPLAPGLVSEDPEGDDIEAALARVSAINDTDADTVDRITTALADTDPNNYLTILDNPPTSMDAQDSALTEQTLASRTTEAEHVGHSGDAAMARDLYAVLVADSTRILGPDHPGTLAARYNHAQWTGEAGDAATARDLSTVLVADSTRILGPDHPGTLAARYNHAEWTGEAGDAATARDLSTVLVADCTRVLGPGHPGTLAADQFLSYWSSRAKDTNAPP